jgi:peptidoglycan/xylan/chitin deacetylase (PgdA/CDA1 family)
MGWSDLRRLHDSGWTIGSHGLSHAPLAKLTALEARREMEDSRRQLADRLGCPVPLLAYPFGTPMTVSNRDRTLAREAGYTAAFLAVTGRLRPSDNAYALPRSKVLGGDRPSVFEAILAGRLDAWRFIERLH